MANFLTSKVTNTVQAAGLTAIAQSASESLFDWAADQTWTQTKSGEKAGQTWLTGTVRGFTEVAVGTALLSMSRGGFKKVGEILGAGMVVSGVYNLTADTIKGFFPNGNGKDNSAGLLASYTSGDRVPELNGINGLGSHQGTTTNALGSLY